MQKKAAVAILISDKIDLIIKGKFIMNPLFLFKGNGITKFTSLIVQLSLV